MRRGWALMQTDQVQRHQANDALSVVSLEATFRGAGADLTACQEEACARRQEPNPVGEGGCWLTRDEAVSMAA